MKQVLAKRRLTLLVGLLACSLMFLVISRYDSVTSLIPWPSACINHEPYGFSEFKKNIRDMGYPGFQLSGQDAEGNIYHCAAGWARFWPWPETLNEQHIMRYASLTKIFTVISAMQFYQEGGDLSTLLVDALSLDKTNESSVNSIMLTHLLEHTSGFDRHVSGDPMMDSSPWCPYRVEHLLSVDLDHEPGEIYQYSNLGYCLLGQAISSLKKRDLKEIFYKDIFHFSAAKNIFPLERNQVIENSPKNFFDKGEGIGQLLSLDYEAMIASGGWAGSAKDLFTVLSIFFGGSARDGIFPEDVKKFFLATSGCDITKWRACHGKGFYEYRRADEIGIIYWRDASLPGVTGFLALGDDGQIVVFLSHYRHFYWIQHNDQLGMLIYSWLTRS